MTEQDSHDQSNGHSANLIRNGKGSTRSLAQYVTAVPDRFELYTTTSNRISELTKQQKPMLLITRFIKTISSASEENLFGPRDQFSCGLT